MKLLKNLLLIKGCLINSAEYWRLREDKQRLKNIKDEKEYDKKI